MSAASGKIVQMSTDHKPSNENEFRRIIAAGGDVYQNPTVSKIDDQGRRIMAPMRVIPGRLAVSRSFGDCAAKLERWGGNPNCLIAEPEVNMFPLSQETDMVLMGSDGIFDALSNKEIFQLIHQKAQDLTLTMPADTVLGGEKHVQACCGTGVNGIIEAAMESESTDNLSVILLVFKGAIRQFE
jgi:protein phosphatase 2C family protein 2/3